MARCTFWNVCCFGSYFNWGFAGLHNSFGGRVWGGGAIWVSKNSFFNKCAPWCMWQRTMPNFATSDGGVLRLRVAGLLLEPLNVGAKSNFISYNLWTISYSWSTVYLFKYDPQLFHARKQISLNLTQVIGLSTHTPHPISDCTVNIGHQARVEPFRKSVFCFQDKLFCNDPIILLQLL